MEARPCGRSDRLGFHHRPLCLVGHTAGTRSHCRQLKKKKKREVKNWNGRMHQQQMKSSWIIKQQKMSKVGYLTGMWTDTQVNNHSYRDPASQILTLSPSNAILVRKTRGREGSVAEKMHWFQSECNSQMLSGESVLVTANPGSQPTPIGTIGLTMSRVGDSGAETSLLSFQCGNSASNSEALPTEVLHDTTSCLKWAISTLSHKETAVFWMRSKIILLTIKRVFS